MHIANVFSFVIILTTPCCPPEKGQERGKEEEGEEKRRKHLLPAGKTQTHSSCQPPRDVVTSTCTLSM